MIRILHLFGTQQALEHWAKHEIDCPGKKLTMQLRGCRAHLLAADFDWNETGECVLVFKWPKAVAVGGNCDQNIDAAMHSTEAVREEKK